MRREGGGEERMMMRRGRKWLKEAVPSTENNVVASVVCRQVSGLVLFCPVCKYLAVSNVPCQLPVASKPKRTHTFHSACGATADVQHILSYFILSAHWNLLCSSADMI